MSLSWDAVFCGDFTIYDFYDVVEGFDTNQQKEEEIVVVEENIYEEEVKPELCIEIPTPTSQYSKSPKRRTFGAQFAELKEEIAELKLEIELKNTQIFHMLYEIYHNKLKK
jgi:hypothetical protein